MRKSFSLAGGLVVVLFFLTGCFDTHFNFKTVVHHDGSIDRETKIDGRGAGHFLPPQGPKWEVKTSETKGGQTILDDTQHHIYAKGHFKTADEIGSDFSYDVASLVENVTEKTRTEFIEELGIKEPFEEDIFAKNKVQITKKRSFWNTEYTYSETFQNRWLIPILILDLKKEIVRKEAAVISAPAAVPAEPPADGSQIPDAPKIASALLAPEKLEALAYQKLKEEILPLLHFHSELMLPGQIISSNAKTIHRDVAVWDFTGLDFDKNYSTFELQAKSRAQNWGILSAIAVMIAVVFAALWARLSAQPKKKKR